MAKLLCEPQPEAAAFSENQRKLVLYNEGLSTASDYGKVSPVKTLSARHAHGGTACGGAVRHIRAFDQANRGIAEDHTKAHCAP